MSETLKNNISDDTNKMITSIISKLELDKLPEEVNISTMTLVCKFDTIFNCRNIARFVELSFDNILSVKYGKEEDLKTNRTLLQKKQKTGKKKKKKSVFYNQVSLYIAVKGKGKNPVSMKLFSNGAVQMTGCKTIDNAVEALTKIFPELQKIKAIIVKNAKTDELKIVEKPFVTVPSVLNFKCMKDFKISMINSNFFMFSVDRTKLYNLLLKDEHDVSYDPGKHACVNVKYEHIEKTISIFVFEKGSIIITGAQTCGQICDAYNFINKYILTNYNAIIKDDNLMNANIVKYLDKENMREECIFGNDVIHIPGDDNDFDDEYDENLSDSEFEIDSDIGFDQDSDDEKPKKINKHKQKIKVEKSDDLEEKPQRKSKQSK